MDEGLAAKTHVVKGENKLPNLPFDCNKYLVECVCINVHMCECTCMNAHDFTRI